MFSSLLFTPLATTLLFVSLSLFLETFKPKFSGNGRGGKKIIQSGQQVSEYIAGAGGCGT